MPVLVRGEWLNKTFALARLLATWAQHIGLTQNVVDCSWTAGDDVGVHHHQCRVADEYRFVQSQPNWVVTAWAAEEVTARLRIGSSR
jgi:hypothetical protein